MEKFRRAVSLGLIAAVSLFLLAALVLTLRARSRDYSFYENRMLAPRPVLTAAGMLDGSYFSALEDWLIDHAAGHNALSRLDVRADLLLRRPRVNDVVARGDLLLPWNDYESVSEDAVSAAAARMADNLASVDALVSSYGGRFCYAAVPCQYAYYEDRYPAYLNSRAVYTRLSRASLAAALSARGVAFLDMGPLFDSLGHPPEFSSSVDNHYGILGAYETYRALLDVLDPGGAAIPRLAAEDFTAETLPQPYLGSRMRKLLGAWPAEERLTILTPNEPVPFTRTDDGRPSPSVVYALPGADSAWVTYDLYMGGDSGNTVIDTQRPDLPTLLIYGDSFTNAVECLAYLSFDQMHSLDLRNYSGELTLGAYIEAYRPDYVVCLRDYEALLLTAANGVGVGGTKEGVSP